MDNTTGETTTITCDCPYRNVCSDNGKKCETCRHNPRRSYYEPVEHYYPYHYHPYHYYPWIITWDINNNTSYYQST